MLNDVIDFSLYLALAVSLNMAFGIYKNVSVKKMCFDFGKFGAGVIKALIVAYGFVGTAILYDKMAISFNIDVIEVELTSVKIIQSAIILYYAKALKNLIEIFGLKGNEIVKK